MMVGTGYTARPLCDGQSLASPGRWPPECRRYPDCDSWKEVSKLLIDYSKKWGTADLLMKLALGRVEKCPFPEDSVLELKRKLVRTLEGTGHGLARTTDDRDDVLIDFRLLQALLAAAQDPEVSLGDFAVGPGARLPRLPALYDAKTLEIGRTERSTGIPGRQECNRRGLEPELQVVVGMVRRAVGGTGRPKHETASTEVN